MKRYVLIFCILIFFTTQRSFSQNYTRAAGIRGGSQSELTFRSYTRESHAYEFLFNMNRKNLRVTALWLQFEPFQTHKTDNLWLVYGFGAHAGYTYTDKYQFLFRSFTFEDKMLAPVIGFDGYVAVEYRLPEIPLILGADYKPNFQFSTRQYFGLHLGELGFNIKIQF